SRGGIHQGQCRSAKISHLASPVSGRRRRGFEMKGGSQRISPPETGLPRSRSYLIQPCLHAPVLSCHGVLLAAQGTISLPFSPPFSGPDFSVILFWQTH